MERRHFIKNTLVTSTLLTASSSVASALAPPPPAKHTFKLRYAPHEGMFAEHAGKDVLDQLRFMADQGFTAFEDNGMAGRPVALQEQMGKLMDKLGIAMGVFVVNLSSAWKPSLTTGTTESREDFVRLCQEAVTVAKRCNAKWMTVVPGYYQRSLPQDIQTANVLECLRRGADVLAPQGLAMVLEPLSDTPELFLRHAAQTFMICKAVQSPACKLLYDIYHMQRNEGNLLPTMEQCWDEIAYVQIGDNPGRKEPTTGEVNYKNIFKFLHERHYDGILGMEHGNSRPGKEGEQAVIDAYIASDSF